MSGLSPALVRALTDRAYEKRRVAAQELEEQVRSLASAGRNDEIHALISTLTNEFVFATQPASRKGGLIGLASVAVALYADVTPFLSALLAPALRSLSDLDSSVRFFACESIYNLCNAARDACIVHFNDLFDGLCKLAADPDRNVVSGGELLGRLLKDLVTESTVFEVETFLPLLCDCMQISAPPVRALLLSWLDTFDHAPHISLLRFVPDIALPLLDLLRTPDEDVQASAAAMLERFARIYVEDPSSDFTRVMPLLPRSVAAAGGAGGAASGTAGSERCLRAALDWSSQLLAAVPDDQDAIPSSAASPVSPQLLEERRSAAIAIAADLLKVTLPHLSHPDDDLRAAAETLNGHLQRLASSVTTPLLSRPQLAVSGPLAALLASCVRSLLAAATHADALDHTFVPTRLGALAWCAVLLPAASAAQRQAAFDAVLLRLADPADAVVLKALEVLAVPASDFPQLFHALFDGVVAVFLKSPPLLAVRGPTVTRKLASLLGPERALRALAQRITTIPDHTVAVHFVETLHLVLLTSPEMHPVRDVISHSSRPNQPPQPNHTADNAPSAPAPHDTERELAGDAPLAAQLELESLADAADQLDVFSALMESWAMHPVAALGLALLARRYSLAEALVRAFGRQHVTVPFLTQVDRLVQLLECPVFAPIRMDLLDPADNVALYRTLYGLLLLLPRGPASDALQHRVSSVVGLLSLPSRSSSAVDPAECALVERISRVSISFFERA
jgi:vacuole morphology and inheritance protein 14